KVFVYIGGMPLFIVNVEAAIFKKNQWLIIKRSEKEEHAGGLLSLVGGKVDIEGNTVNILERTIKREIFEEVDIKVKEEVSYLLSTSFVTDTQEHVVNISFLCEYESGEAIPKSPDEVAAVYWLTAEQIYNHPNAPDYLKASMKQAEKFKNTHIIN